MKIEFVRSPAADRAAGRNASLFDLPRVPPGEYRLTPVADAPRGWLMIGIGRDQFAIHTAPILESARNPFTCAFRSRSAALSSGEMRMRANRCAAWWSSLLSLLPPDQI